MIKNIFVIGMISLGLSGCTDSYTTKWGNDTFFSPQDVIAHELIMLNKNMVALIEEIRGLKK